MRHDVHREQGVLPLLWNDVNYHRSTGNLREYVNNEEFETLLEYGNWSPF